MFVEPDPAGDDAARGSLLQTILNQATAGDTVVLGPGGYKTSNVTRDGVYVELHSGARIYNDTISAGPIINVTGGTHRLFGRGIIENASTSPVLPGRAIQVTAGTLICEADEIVSSASSEFSAVYANGATAVLYLNARKVLAKFHKGLEIQNCTCYVRVQHVVAEGATGSVGVDVSAGSSSSVRIINVDRIDSKDGPAIFLQGTGRSNVWSQSVHGSNSTAVQCTGSLHYMSLGRVTNSGSAPAVKLESGHLVAKEVEHLGTAGHAVEMSSGSRLSANRIVAAVGTITNNGIKIVSSTLGNEPIIDVGEIVVGTDADTLSIFAINTARNVFLIRNYRSLRGISNIIILSPNHP